jgi:hypothetical protein
MGVTLNYDTGSIMHLWANTKDIYRICEYVDTSQLGVFVRVVLRVISYLDEMKPVLLGLEKYELYNRLENHHDRLLCGIVTNQSLYVNSSA